MNEAISVSPTGEKEKERKREVEQTRLDWQRKLAFLCVCVLAILDSLKSREDEIHLLEIITT